MSGRTVLAAVIFGALLLLAPGGGASAHPGHVHAAPPQNAAAPAAAKDGVDATRRAVPRAELKAQTSGPADAPLDQGCADRGCCGSGHCSSCLHALAPIAWSGFGSPADMRLHYPDTGPPSALAREGPPRPPKSFA
jgi:hypothetical protein